MFRPPPSHILTSSSEKNFQKLFFFSVKYISVTKELSFWILVLFYFDFGEEMLLKIYSPMVSICTTSLTSNNSMFYPHSILTCFVWISEQTAIISLHIINLLVFITETESVYCAVRTEFFLYKLTDFESLIG